MRVVKKKFALNIGSNYIASNGMYVKHDGSLDTQYVIVATDFGGNSVGTLNYCYMSLPTDIDDQADNEYYESLLESGQTIEDVPHKSIDEYEWSYPAYFTLSSGATPTLTSDGLDYPVSLEVLPPGRITDEDGDVFNRVYEVSTGVVASSTEMNNLTNSKIWIDKASMIASISAISNVPDWKNLIYVAPSLADLDDNVPPRMREKVDKLVSKIVFLDDDYFTLTLTQLKTFLSMIRGELGSGFGNPSTSIDDISKICNFKYTISQINFKNHSSEKDNWNKEDGLFGYRDGIAGTRYGNCL